MKKSGPGVQPPSDCPLTCLYLRVFFFFFLFLPSLLANTPFLVHFDGLERNHEKLHPVECSLHEIPGVLPLLFRRCGKWHSRRNNDDIVLEFSANLPCPQPSGPLRPGGEERQTLQLNWWPHCDNPPGGTLHFRERWWEGMYTRYGGSSLGASCILHAPMDTDQGLSCGPSCEWQGNRRGWGSCM